MTVILKPHTKIPMMFRAQVDGRCQLQRLVKDQEPDTVKWADEWVDKIAPVLPELGGAVRSRVYEITWRLITNSGVDDSIIRPVIGARGWAFYPGSGMKGLFRRACTKEQTARYCGRPLANNDWAPGILRFEGGYPVDASWTKNMVDIVHPQQAWQVESQKSSAAFAQISLYKPTLRFGISCTETLSEEEWETVWGIWERSIAKGLGSRVSAGYGHVKTGEGSSSVSAGLKVLYKTRLKGQGQAPMLLDGKTGEFRPNMFRAGLRGHALRIFGGLTDERTAVRLVEGLFGGISEGEGMVGLVGLRFQESKLELPIFEKGKRYEKVGYEVEGELSLLLVRDLELEKEKVLRALLAKLVQFAMVLGGFGKSWRRSDHRLFFEEYYEESNPLIGCHWQWDGDDALRRNGQVRSPDKLGDFLDKVVQSARDWMGCQGVKPGRVADWREAWHPGRVQVWGRLAEDKDESEAIRWFHGDYRRKIAGAQAAGSIYKCESLTGKVGRVGRLWHRMYPKVRLVKDPENPQRPKPIKTREYVELLTIFPDDSRECDNFLGFLQEGPFGFKLLWGDE